MKTKKKFFTNENLEEILKKKKKKIKEFKNNLNSIIDNEVCFLNIDLIDIRIYEEEKKNFINKIFGFNFDKIYLEFDYYNINEIYLWLNIFSFIETLKNVKNLKKINITSTDLEFQKKIRYYILEKKMKKFLKKLVFFKKNKLLKYLKILDTFENFVYLKILNQYEKVKNFSDFYFDVKNKINFDNKILLINRVLEKTDILLKKIEIEDIEIIVEKILNKINLKEIEKKRKNQKDFLEKNNYISKSFNFIRRKTFVNFSDNIRSLFVKKNFSEINLKKNQKIIKSKFSLEIGNFLIGVFHSEMTIGHFIIKNLQIESFEKKIFLNLKKISIEDENNIFLEHKEKFLNGVFDLEKNNFEIFICPLNFFLNQNILTKFMFFYNENIKKLLIPLNLISDTKKKKKNKKKKFKIL